MKRIPATTNRMTKRSASVRCSVYGLTFIASPQKMTTRPATAPMAPVTLARPDVRATTARTNIAMPEVTNPACCHFMMRGYADVDAAND